MSDVVVVPRKGTGIGCFGVGCVTIICLLLFLVVAFIGGGYFALHYLQKRYSADEPLSFANISAGERSRVSSDATPAPGELVESTDAEAPAPAVSRESVAAIQARWRAFEKAANRHEKARVELTASDINTLIENDPKLRGKAAVSIQDNVARVQVSIPLGDIFMMNGRYLNGEATVEPAGDGNPESAHISNIVLANQAVPDDVLDRRLFGWSTMRGYMTDWLHDNEVAYFSIQNNHVIGETRGPR